MIPFLNKNPGLAARSLSVARNAALTLQMRRSSRRRLCAVATLLYVTSVATTASAADRFYLPNGLILPCSTAFSDPMCWIQGQPPGVSDKAIFQAPTVPLYNVNLSNDVGISALSVNASTVNFLLNGRTIKTDVFDVARGTSEVATAMLASGALDTMVIDVGSGSGADGLLQLADVDTTVQRVFVGVIEAIGNNVSRGRLNIGAGSNLQAQDIDIGLNLTSPAHLSELLVSGSGTTVFSNEIRAAVLLNEGKFEDLNEHQSGSDFFGAGQARISVEDGAILRTNRLFLGEPGELVIDGGKVSVEGLISFSNTMSNLVFLDGELEITGALATEKKSVYGDRFGLTNLLIGAEINGGNPLLVLKDSAYIDDSGSTSIGHVNNGEIQLKSGATLRSQTGLVGVLGDGKISVDGAGTRWLLSNELLLGSSGDAIVEITNGGLVTSGSAVVGDTALMIFNAPNRGAAVTIDGVNSEWQVTGDLSIGGDANGTSAPSSLTVRNNARIDVGGSITNSVPGTLNVSGGTLLATSVVNTGQFNLDGSHGASTVNAIVVNQGGSVNLSNNAEVTFHQDFSIDSTASLNIETGSKALFEAVFASANPSITGGGQISLGGSFSPGSSPIRMLIEPDLELLSSHELTMEIGGISRGSEYDVIDVFGNLTLGGTLIVELKDFGGGLFIPQAGDEFALFGAGVIAGSFDEFVFGELDPGLRWMFSVQADVVGGVDVATLSVAAVPLPASAMLLLLPLAGLLRVRRHP